MTTNNCGERKRWGCGEERRIERGGMEREKGEGKAANKWGSTEGKKITERRDQKEGKMKTTFADHL